jgi:hypothetical protein
MTGYPKAAHSLSLGNRTTTNKSGFSVKQQLELRTRGAPGDADILQRWTFG